MKKTLFVDATVRPESRTRELAIHLVRNLRCDVQKVKLIDEDIPATCSQLLEFRDHATARGEFGSKYFRYAKQFAEADYIVIAAPYWDLSFPAVLKKYIEAVTINGITFTYSEKGEPVGLCHGKKLFYVTTSGGPFLFPEFSSGYLKTLALDMYGIADYQCIAAENLDVYGTDVKKVLAEAKEVINRSVQYSNHE